LFDKFIVVIKNIIENIEIIDINFCKVNFSKLIFFKLEKKITNIINGKTLMPYSISWTCRLLVTLLIIFELNVFILGYKNKDLKVLAKSVKVFSKTNGGCSLGKLFKKDKEAVIFDAEIIKPTAKDNIK
jgi:ABC-type uncharacterized transport system permease subunit